MACFVLSRLDGAGGEWLVIAGLACLAISLFLAFTKAPTAGQPAAVQPAAVAGPAGPGMFAGMQAKLAQSSWQRIGFGIAVTLALGRSLYLIFWGGWGLLHAGAWFAVVAALLWMVFFNWSSFGSIIKAADDFIMGRTSLWAVALTAVVMAAVLIFTVWFVWSGLPTT